VVKTAEVGEGDDWTGFGTVNRTRSGGVPIQRKVAARPVIVVKVPFQDPAQIRFVEYDDVIQILPP